jgi:preprotein translocase subunit SecD
VTKEQKRRMAEWAALLLILENRSKRAMSAAMRLPLALPAIGGTRAHVEMAMRTAGRKAITAVRSHARDVARTHWVKTSGVSVQTDVSVKSADEARAATSSDSLARQWSEKRNAALIDGKSEAEASQAASDAIESAVERTAVTEAADALNAEIARANADARARGYKVTETWNAILDSRTCEECFYRDGQQRVAPDFFDPPPVHARCRCVLVTEIEG